MKDNIKRQVSEHMKLKSKIQKGVPMEVLEIDLIKIISSMVLQDLKKNPFIYDYTEEDFKKSESQIVNIVTSDFELLNDIDIVIELIKDETDENLLENFNKKLELFTNLKLSVQHILLDNFGKRGKFNV